MILLGSRVSIFIILLFTIIFIIYLFYYLIIFIIFHHIFASGHPIYYFSCLNISA